MVVSQRYKVFKTICMVLGPITLGLFLELAGPALPDLKNKLWATYEEIARVLVARSIGYFISALLGGALADYFPHHTEVVLSASYLLGSLATAGIPWSEALWVMAILFHIQGLAQGLIDTCNNSLCARIWGEKAAVPLHALHFGFGVGALLAPVLAGPFISEVSSSTDEYVNYTKETTHYTTVITSSLQTEATEDLDKSTKSQHPEYSEAIIIPYTISSILTLSMSVGFLGLYIYEKCSSNNSKQNKAQLHKTQEEDGSNELCQELNELADPQIKQPNETAIHEKCSLTDLKQKSEGGNLIKMLQIFSPGSCTNGDTVFGIKIFFLIFIFYLNIVGGERAYGKYLYTYAIESPSGFNKDQATLLNSLFWLCFTAGRGIAIFLSKVLKPAMLLSFELLINVTLGIIMCIWGYDVKIVLFITTGLLGLTLSPIFPGGLAWTNIYLKLSGVAMAIVFTGGACGGMIYQWLTGWLFDVYGSQSLSYVMLVYAIVLSCTFILMLLTVRRRGPLIK